MNSSSTVPMDFAKRRSAHQTLRDRRRLKAMQPPITDADLQGRTLKTECFGCACLGFLSGAGLVAFFWILVLWVDAGGSP